MRRLFVALCLCFGAVAAYGQTCSPIGGLGNVQFLDNTGVPLTSGVLYSFVAGTSTQQATFTDSTCTVQNVNPITFGSGARVAIWLITANFYKFVLCSQNDGASCAGGDILFSVDQVPGGVTGGGGGGGSPFISASANPATSGILRLATGDTICWRNTANSSNLCFTKDTNDLLSWAGGSFKLPEVGAPGCVPTFDQIWADSTAHRWKVCNNGGIPVQLVVGGTASADINATDQVVQVHFGATATPLSSTAPTTGQFLQWNGANIVGAGLAGSADATAQASNITTTTLVAVSASAAGTYRFECVVVETQAATTSSTLPQCTAAWTDKDSGAAESIVMTGATTSNTIGAIGIGGTTGFGGVITIEAKASTNISYSTANYASSGATPMQYAIHVKAELIGP